MNRAMQAAMEQRHRQAVVWFYEATDAVRMPESGPEFAEFLAKKYRGTRIDAVVLVTQSAADLLLPFRSHLWPQAPVIAHSLSVAAARRLPPQPGLFVLPTNWDYLGTLRIARKLQPNARKVIVVAGDSRFDQGVLDSARMTLQPDSLGIPIEFVVGQPPRAVAARLQKESLASIVLFLAFFRDGEGGVHVPRDVLQMLSAASAAPIYGIFDSYVGHGVTAGEMESFAEVGERAAELVVAALAQPAAAPAVLSPVPSRCVADARQLERYGLPARLLPDGCDVRFVEPSFVRRYWWQTLLAATAIVGQSILIALLLLHRRRRRSAELNLAAQRVQLLHASRLAVAGELTASIAHEINQPLGAILSNAEAAELLVQSGRLERPELLQILADIRRDDLRASEVIKRLRALLARHEVERHRVDINRLVEDTSAVVRTEARRRGATVEYALRAQQPDVIGDRVQIQQVVINLMLNAFDASASSPEDARRVLVGTADLADGVQLTVRDFGQGIAAADLPRLFDPFFSTKSGGMGLGLSIARSIVEAHGGTLTAETREAGAEFRIVLPRATSTDLAGPAERRI
jgi:signal transduction histidine kinase